MHSNPNVKMTIEKRNQINHNLLILENELKRDIEFEVKKTIKKINGCWLNDIKHFRQEN